MQYVLVIAMIKKSLVDTQILQFGTGKFLRGFVDVFVQEVKDTGTVVLPITVVQSTGVERVKKLRSQHCRYTAHIRGITGDNEVTSDLIVQSIGKALHAENDWLELIDISCQAKSIIITSNVTEAGYVLDNGSVCMNSCPKFFPAKLLAILANRFNAGLSDVIVAPCELIENNGHELCGMVVKQAKLWGVEDACIEWIREDVVWLNTLVDRIVASPYDEHNCVSFGTLDVITEPYALWAIQSNNKDNLLFEHNAIVSYNNLSEVALRKIRILNGAHTALVQSLMPDNDLTVREALDNPEVLQWLKDLLYGEIAPTISSRVTDALEFVDTTLSRLYNPFIKHRLSDIRLMHETKLRMRLLPTYHEFIEQNGKKPPILSELLKDLS